MKCSILFCCVLSFTCAGWSTGCNKGGGNGGSISDTDTDVDTDTDIDTDTDADTDTDIDTDTDSDSDTGPDPLFTVVTFNTGTTDNIGHLTDGDDYLLEQVDISDQYYGNGLAWMNAINHVTTWFAALQPDVVVFQEIFYSGDCPGIPSSAYPGFVCETWSPGDPTVAQVLLGSGYQVACHPGKSDKCLAVKKSFGSIRQCSDPDFCLEGLDGESISDCGGGARIARATIDLVSGGEITVVNVHGTSGISGDDKDCRVEQVEQIFVDMDGELGANGVRNVVLGDLNIDPGRVPALLDPSVAAWNQYVGGSQPFQWISPIGPSAPPTYTGGLNIDHVISDEFTGTCYAPGVTLGYPPVYPNVYFDHKPLVCEIGDL